MSGEIPFNPDEFDAPVPKKDTEIPVHLVFEFAEESVDDAEDKIITDAYTRLEQATQNVEQTDTTNVAAEPTPHELQERTESEKQLRRDEIMRIGAALARERRRHFTYSLAVDVPYKRRQY